MTTSLKIDREFQITFFFKIKFMHLNPYFWKTPYNQLPAVPATSGIVHKKVSYIIGEIIHVKITPQKPPFPFVIDQMHPHQHTREGKFNIIFIASC